METVPLVDSSTSSRRRIRVQKHWQGKPLSPVQPTTFSAKVRGKAIGLTSNFMANYTTLTIW